MAKYEDVRLEPSANGGLILSYSCVTPNKNGDKYSPMEREYKKETFGKGETDKAYARMQELSGTMPEEEKEEEKPEEKDTEDTEEVMDEHPVSMNNDDVTLPHEME